MTKAPATPPSSLDHGTAPPVVSAGLTSDEARQRLASFGRNEVSDRPPAAIRVFLQKLWAPIPWLLEFAILLQLLLGERVEAAVIAGLLLFNAALGFAQESRAGATLAALKKRLAPTALVRRDGTWIKLPAAELVPGDVVRLALGAIVPADARLVSGSVLIDQSMLTGESVPVEAEAGAPVYASALVRRGMAVAEVTATGAKSYFGRAAELVRVAHGASTEQRAILAATRNLAAINGVIAVLLVLAAHFMNLPPAELVRLALTALLASIPVALPATFTLSAALGAQVMAHRGALLTRLSAAHEAAAMDVLCADKTGTLTQNSLTVAEVAALPGFERSQVLALAALASAETDQDPIDATIRRAAAAPDGATPRLQRFVPFDPATRVSEALALTAAGETLRVVKGAFHVIADIAAMPEDAGAIRDRLAAQGNRLIAVAAGPPASLRLAGVIAISDPPRADSAQLVATLKQLGVRTVMITGDSPVTAVAIAAKVGIDQSLCPPEQMAEPASADAFGVFARVVPEDKFRLVQALQRTGHVVGMCGDGANDAPALRQAQIGIAVSSATDAAKSAAGMVLTEPGLAGIVLAVREGRTAFRRLLTYTLSTLAKKFEAVLFLALGLAVTGQAVMTPVLMVLLLVTNDFLSMSLTTDRESPAPAPSVWHMRNATWAALILGFAKLGFSIAVVAVGSFALGLHGRPLQSLAFAALVLGNQALLYVLRERGPLWASRPSLWVLASTAVDVAIVASLVLSGTLTAALPVPLFASLALAAVVFALLLDLLKRPVLRRFRVE